ncbi:hypothetical protein [Pseudoxanthomonas composti]|uniref:Uncharacterized protein n=1 Tax=Pseudoxanthomonas composti TaxID=2137479 RepID=A0A4Q1JWS1_9GAMM|nr:hypothetical protein [Pseudoxanthomonas composti]RXR06497.1 hypothetical protein EPA99_07575 [Pseudoxanthomonas composti]
MSAMPPAPPPLPHATAPHSGFVNVLAWVTIAMAVLGGLSGLVQAGTAAVLPADHTLRMLFGGAEPGPRLPPLFHWYYTHGLITGLASVLLSALLGAAAWGLLQRREWGRRAFIAMVVLGTLMQLASLALLPQMVDMVVAMQEARLSIETGGPVGPLPPEFAQMMRAMMLIPAALMVVFAGFHVWIIWKLGRPEIRAEFSR